MSQKIEGNLADLPTITSMVIKQLLKSRPFVLWLLGPLGVGKTTFVAQALKDLGLAKTIPVLSPSFTYQNEYYIKGDYYAHIDLYKLEQNQDIFSLNLFDARSYRGYFIEWPERLPENFDLKPTHKMLIQFANQEHKRLYQFE